MVNNNRDIVRLPSSNSLACGTTEKHISLLNETNLFAQAFSVIEFKSKRELLEKIRDIIQEKEVSKIVVGLPRRTDGKEGWAEKQVKKFVDWLRKSLSLGVVTWDERYTSVEANEELKHMGYGIAESRKVIDKVAASIILKNYMENQA